MNKTLPIPDNPSHVQNLQSVDLLKQRGFEGLDASLAISLSEYGLAWCHLEHEILFVYQIAPGRFDRCTMKPSLDVQKEYNWVDFGSLMNWLGATLDEWLQLPLPIKIFDLFNYHGTENIFGSSYWEGFEILGLDKE